VKQPNATPVLKLITRRFWTGLVGQMSFTLRWVAGFALFALILWLLKIAILDRIETNYLEGVKSEQFKTYDELYGTKSPAMPESVK
jgi:hypothetical protein